MRLGAVGGTAERRAPTEIGQPVPGIDAEVREVEGRVQSHGASGRQGVEGVRLVERLVPDFEEVPDVVPAPRVLILVRLETGDPLRRVNPLRDPHQLPGRHPDLPRVEDFAVLPDCAAQEANLIPVHVVGPPGFIEGRQRSVLPLQVDAVLLVSRFLDIAMMEQTAADLEV